MSEFIDIIKKYWGKKNWWNTKRTTLPVRNHYMHRDYNMPFSISHYHLFENMAMKKIMWYNCQWDYSPQMTK